MAERGRAEEGVGRIRESLHALRGVRSVNTEPYYLAQAQAAFRRAVETARRPRARGLELRALVSATRAAPPTCTAPRRALARTYRWFTEGFDTVDLQEARALLATGC
jgi:adenylate cyclase